MKAEYIMKYVPLATMEDTVNQVLTHGYVVHSWNVYHEYGSGRIQVATKMVAILFQGGGTR